MAISAYLDSLFEPPGDIDDGERIHLPQNGPSSSGWQAAVDEWEVEQ